MGKKRFGWDVRVRGEEAGIYLWNVSVVACSSRPGKYIINIRNSRMQICSLYQELIPRCTIQPLYTLLEGSVDPVIHPSTHKTINAAIHSRRYENARSYVVL